MHNTADTGAIFRKLLHFLFSEMVALLRNAAYCIIKAKGRWCVEIFSCVSSIVSGPSNSFFSVPPFIFNLVHVI